MTCLWAATQASWRRSRWVAAPSSPPDLPSRRTCRPMRWHSVGHGRAIRPAPPRHFGLNSRRGRAMCGIVGYVGHKKVVPVLLEGLKRLEYRGYDSAGLAILQPDRVGIYRSVGKIKELEHALWGRDLSGEVGLGHTRWATHGRPTEENAHPHSDCTGDVVVVHNGIIENYLALKEKLQQEGHHFKSETDTEVLAHLIEKQLQETADLEIAVRRALSSVVGAYALGVLWRGDPHRLVAARNGSPSRGP